MGSLYYKLHDPIIARRPSTLDLVLAPLPHRNVGSQHAGRQTVTITQHRRTHNLIPVGLSTKRGTSRGERNGYYRLAQGLSCHTSGLKLPQTSRQPGKRPTVSHLEDCWQIGKQHGFYYIHTLQATLVHIYQTQILARFITRYILMQFSKPRGRIGPPP